MIDRLEAALRRYEIIRPTADRPQRMGKTEEFAQWMTEYVCPAIEPLVARPDFRRLARWSIDNLAPVIATPARQLVDAVDRAFVGAGRTIAELTRQAPLRALLESPSDGGTSNSPNLPSADLSAAETMPDTIASFLAERPWHDLVSVHDFFSPVAELNLINREAWLGPGTANTQISEFCPYTQPHLGHPGDYIARSLLTRITYWQSRLQRFLVRCDGLLRGVGSETTCLRDALWAAFRQVTSASPLVEDVCLHDSQARLRQSAAALTQIFGAYRPRADFSWLGEAGQMAGNATSLRYFVDRRADVGIVEAVAGALSELSTLARSTLDPEDVITAKINELPFVLVYGRGRQELYWQGELTDIDWLKKYRRAWTLLVAMAEKALHGQGVDEADDLGVSLKDAKADLKRILPPDLGELLLVQQRVYTLKISRELVYVARFDQEDRLTEVT